MIIISTLISISVTLLLIPLSKNLTDIFTQKSFSGLIFLASSVIAIYIIRGVFIYLQSYFTAQLSFNYISELRYKLYRLIFSQSYESEILNNNGLLITNLTDDTEKIKEMIFSIVTELIPGIITVSFTLIYSIYINWRLAIFIFILVPLISLIINLFSNLIKEKSEKTQDSLSHIYSLINENFHNLLLIKTKGYENYKLNQYAQYQEKYKNSGIKVINYISLQPSIINIIQVTGICIIACFGAYQVFEGQIELAGLLSFATALSLTIEPAIFITKSLGMIEKAKVSVKNIKTNLSILQSNQQIYGNEKLKNNFNISFQHINFKYSGQESNFGIKDFNLEIKTGDTVAFIGDNGSGKSTVVKMLLRLNDSYEGLIKIGENNLKDYLQDELRKSISASFHDPFIFNTSIRNNILMSLKNIDNELLEKVCHITKTDEFSNTLKDGLDYITGEKGENLSTGQRQKISIARAVINQPKILILDEATSAIDLESEKFIYSELRKFLPDSIFIIINHRTESLDFVDKKIYF